MQPYIILVEPKYAGNAGAVARLMKNFGFRNLVLINPSFSLDNDDCRKFAMHAQEILDEAILMDSFDEIVEEMDFMVGTTSIESKDDKHHLRKTVVAREFAKEIYKIDGKVGLAFGREDYGLLNEEIKRCDLLVKIPTSDEYPALNLSHAVCILLYELFMERYEPPEFVLADGKEKEKMYEFFDRLLKAINYPEHKMENTRILFRRVIGRAMLSKWEYHTLMGVFKKAIQAAEGKKLANSPESFK
ncbi:MAG: RNA methyltransferase [Thermoplasmata archaeon]|nr:RNA methyltransferase [Thermoplasmata archaeon]